METIVRETGDMIRILEITATATDLEVDLRMALRKQQSVTTLRGFRPGRVPLKMVRRVFAEEVKAIVVESLVKEVFEDLIHENYKVLGEAREVRRDYDLDGDLTVQIEFFVLPEIKLKDLTGMVLETPVLEVNDAVVDFFMKKQIAAHLERRPLKSGERIGEEGVGVMDLVEYEVSKIDRETGRVLIGGKPHQKKRIFEYGSHHFNAPQFDEHREALMNRTVGEEVFLEQEEAPTFLMREFEGSESDFRIKILKAHRYDWPEIDDEWATLLSNDEVDSADEFHDWVRMKAEDFYDEANEFSLIGSLMERMLQMYPFTVPADSLSHFFDIPPDSPFQQMLQDPEVSESFTDRFRWNILLMTIGEQLKEQFPHDFSSPESENRGVFISEKNCEEVTNKLLDSFEIKYIPVPEWQLIQTAVSLSGELTQLYPNDQVNSYGE